MNLEQIRINNVSSNIINHCKTRKQDKLRA